MSVPAAISAEIAAIQAQVTAAEPLSSADTPTIIALQLNAAQLVTDVASAVAAAAGTLDTWVAPADPQQIIAGVLSVEANASDQSSLIDVASFVGRATKNLDQYG